MKIYEEKINSIGAEVSRLETSSKNYDEILKKCAEDLKEFNKVCKTDYATWKKDSLNEFEASLKPLRDQVKNEQDKEKKAELRAELAKQNPFKYLEDKLKKTSSSLTAVQAEHFRLRVEKDKVSGDMVRFAATDKHLAYYCNQILNHFCDNIVGEYVDTIFHQDKNKLKSIGYKFPPVSVEHIIPEKFTQGPVRDLYLGLLTQELTSTSEIDKEQRLYKTVETIVRNSLADNTFAAKSPCDERVFNIIYRTLVRFINFSSAQISEVVKRDNIKTFQEKIIINLFAYTFRVWGQEPFVLKSKDTKKK
jgi:DNA repair exonuclease SbcCD ATPase subunit